MVAKCIHASIKAPGSPSIPCVSPIVSYINHNHKVHPAARQILVNALAQARHKLELYVGNFGCPLSFSVYSRSAINFVGCLS